MCIRDRIEGESNLTYDGTTLNIIDSGGGSGSHRLTVGNSHDLRIYHDGNSNITHHGAGDLYLTSNNSTDLYVRSADDLFLQPQDGEDGIKIIGNGAVELYYDNSKKFETTSGGVSITGNLDLSGDNSISIGTGNDLTIQCDGGNSAIVHNGDGDLVLLAQGSGEDIRLQAAENIDLQVSGSETAIHCDKDGAVELYHNNTKAFSTTQYGVQVESFGSDASRIQFATSGHTYSQIGYFGLNRFGIDTHDGLEVRDASDSYATRMKIDNVGRLTLGDAHGGMDMGFGNQLFSSKSGTYSASIIGSTGAALATSIIYNSNSSFGSSVAMCDWRSARSNNTAFNFLRVSTSSASDNEFFLTGDGNGYADGNWNAGGADYAEYFEWSDGNSSDEDRRGYTVVLDGNKVRIATSSDSTDNIIGVVSGHPTMVGDTAWNKWIGKYQRDDYNAYVRDSNGDRVLNSSYDDTQTYISRKDRKEWDTIGLVGKLRIRKGQPTGTRWLKMRDVSDTIEEWLVR